MFVMYGRTQKYWQEGVDHLETLMELEKLGVLRKLVDTYEPQSIEVLSKYSRRSPEELSAVVTSLEEEGLVERRATGKYDISNYGYGYFQSREVGVVGRNASIFALLDGDRIDTLVQFKLIALASYVSGSGFYEYGDWKKHMYHISNPEMRLALYRFKNLGLIKEIKSKHSRLYTADNIGFELADIGRRKVQNSKNQEWFQELQKGIMEKAELVRDASPKIEKATLQAIYHLWNGDSDDEVRTLVKDHVERSSRYGLDADDVNVAVTKAKKAFIQP